MNACTSAGQCPSGVCLIVGGNSRVCAPSCATEECIPGWSCEPFADTPSICVCSSRSEACNGEDDDCDTRIDEDCRVVCECEGDEIDTERRACEGGQTAPWERRCGGCEWRPWGQVGFCEDLMCPDDSRLCGDRCAVCPTAEATECAGERCVATDCGDDGFRCGDGCCDFAVETIGQGGRFVQIAMHEANVRVAHQSAGRDEVLVARRTGGGSWEQTRVSDEGQPGDSLTFALDTAGRGHVAFVDGLSASLRYAREEADGWAIETVFGNVRSVAIDTVGEVPYLAFFESETRGVLYAERAGGAWDFDRLQAISGESMDMVIDGSGRPNVVFDDGSLRHGVFAAGWQYETIDLRTPSAMDITELPGGGVAATFTLRSGQLLLATRAGGGSWVSRQIIGTSTGAHALSADDDGVVHVVYQDRDGGSVEYLRVDEESAFSTSIDTNGTPGAWVDIALGIDGRPWIAYHVSASNELRVAVPTPRDPE